MLAAPVADVSDAPRAPRLDRRPLIVPAATLVGLGAGGVATLVGSPAIGGLLWALTAALVLVPLAIEVVRAVSRGDIGVDLIALIAIAGALVLGEYLAAAVVALMLAGGNALEESANRRSRRELTSLLARAPHTARVRQAGHLVDVAVADVVPGDIVVVRPGDVVPVDGLIIEQPALVDQSALTGEPLPVPLEIGAPVNSGSVNAGDPFAVRATRPAAESAYAAIVRLVRQAERQRAPFARMADRYAVGFLIVTLLLSGGAWLASGDPVRALAVLVVATPCPLILAAPIAFVAGVSRAARRGIIVKGAAVIEALGRAGTVLFDKTGTLTIGAPQVAAVTGTPGWEADRVLATAFALERLSAHVLADAVSAEALRWGLTPPRAEAVREVPGRGVEGRIEGAQVLVGENGWLAERGVGGLDGQGAHAPTDGRSSIRVAVDGRLVGTIALADHVRADADGLSARLHAAGISRIAIVTGDAPPVAAAVAARVGIEEVHAHQSPADKLALVHAATREDPGGVIMVGDGINDAPALAAASVGIAIGSATVGASAEAADAVVAIDRIDRVAEAVEIGRRSLHIARQSVLVGIGLSVGAMIVAAFGHLPPLGGALFQEVIDVAVILNALRALR